MILHGGTSPAEPGNWGPSNRQTGRLDGTILRIRRREESFGCRPRLSPGGWGWLNPKLGSHIRTRQLRRCFQMMDVFWPSSSPAHDCLSGSKLVLTERVRGAEGNGSVPSRPVSGEMWLSASANRFGDRLGYLKTGKIARCRHRNGASVVKTGNGRPHRLDCSKTHPLPLASHKPY